MRIVALILCAAALTGCTRPTAGYSFHDLVWSASDGLREYEGWVDAAANDGFPDKLCLAGISFEASLAESRSASGSVGLPLAAPAFGLTGMLGYQFISTKSESGTISASLLAKYQADAERTVDQSKEKIEQFAQNIANIREDWRKQLEQQGSAEGSVRTPPTLEEYKHRKRPEFSKRDDLAAELWRIREALHGAVLNSPKNFVLEPGPMVLRVGYVVTKSQGGQASVSLGGKPSGTFGVTDGATELNEMLLLYVENKSPDQMTCNNESFEKDLDFAELVKTASMSVVPAEPPEAPQTN